MALKKVLTALLVSIWVASQFVMSFAHVPTAGSSTHGHAVSAVVADMHSHVDHPSHEPANVADRTTSPSGGHHDHSDLNNCGSAECSVTASNGLADAGLRRVTRIFDLKPDDALRATNPGLQTPPPNTIV